jgi:hypothetical protein
MLYLIFIVLTLLNLIFAENEGNALGPYKVSDITVSGVSSGGYMAVQMHISFSSIINGSAIFAAVSKI